MGEVARLIAKQHDEYMHPLARTLLSKFEAALKADVEHLRSEVGGKDSYYADAMLDAADYLESK